MTKPIDDLPMPPKGDGSTDTETLTHDIEVKLESAIRELIEHEMAQRGIGRRAAAMIVVGKIRGLSSLGPSQSRLDYLARKEQEAADEAKARGDHATARLHNYAATMLSQATPPK